MNKGERISRFVAELANGDVDLTQTDVAKHSFYRAFFLCWNEQRYYEAHDVLEQLWLKDTESRDADFFKGLIQAAGAFFIFKSDSNTHRTRNTGDAYRRPCVCFSLRKRTCRSS